MLRNKITTALTFGIVLSIFTFTACRKNINIEEDTGYANDHATLEKVYSDAQSIADEAGTDGALSNFKMIPSGNILGQCATVTRDTTSIPHVLTIDFGNSNCLCKDGVYRRGQIIVKYSGRYRDLGHSHTITFNNYFQNDNQVLGTKTVTYSSNDAQGNPIYDIEVSGQIILADSAGTISWVSTRTRHWIAGFSTPAWNDDVYEISGSGTVTRANGKTFQMQITTPLHIALDCRWIESGVVSITPENAKQRTLDYGNGTCDALATLTVNGKTYNVTLR